MAYVFFVYIYRLSLYIEEVKQMYRVEQRSGAKFRELNLNFPKLAVCLCMGWPSCLAALRGNFQTWDIYFARPCILLGCVNPSPPFPCFLRLFVVSRYFSVTYFLQSLSLLSWGYAVKSRGAAHLPIYPPFHPGHEPTDFLGLVELVVKLTQQIKPLKECNWPKEV